MGYEVLQTGCPFQAICIGTRERRGSEQLITRVEDKMMGGEKIFHITNIKWSGGYQEKCNFIGDEQGSSMFNQERGGTGVIVRSGVGIINVPKIKIDYHQGVQGITEFTEPNFRMVSTVVDKAVVNVDEASFVRE